MKKIQGWTFTILPAVAVICLSVANRMQSNIVRVLNR